MLLDMESSNMSCDNIGYLRPKENVVIKDLERKGGGVRSQEPKEIRQWPIN